MDKSMIQTLEDISSIFVVVFFVEIALTKDLNPTPQHECCIAEMILAKSLV